MAKVHKMKFANGQKFTFETINSGRNLIMTVRSVSDVIHTNFSFIIEIHDETLVEIQLNKGRSGSYMAEYFDYNFSEENIQEVERFFEILLNNGWKEIHFLGRKGKKLKTVFFYYCRTYKHHFTILKGIAKKSIGEFNDVVEKLKNLFYTTILEQGIRLDTLSGTAVMGGVEFNTFLFKANNANTEVAFTGISYFKSINGHLFSVTLIYNNENLMQESVFIKPNILRDSSRYFTQKKGETIKIQGWI